MLPYSTERGSEGELERGGAGRRRSGDDFAAAHGVDVKPLIEVAGRPMGEWVLRALRDSGQVARVAYVGPLTPEMDSPVDVRVTDRGTLIANLEAGVAALREPGRGERGRAAPRRVLVGTADVPMLTASGAGRAGERSGRGPGLPDRREGCLRGDLSRREAHLRPPQGRHLYRRQPFLLDPSLIGQFLPRLRAVLDARKQPLRLAGIVGPGLIVKMLLGQLTVAELQARADLHSGVEARALITPHAAVGTDIDQDVDLALAERILSAGD